MKQAYRQTIHRCLTALALLMTLGCAPTLALSDCDDKPQHENSEAVAMPDFGFKLSGACNEVSAEPAPSSESAEAEDELLKDIEEPLEAPSSDLAVTLEETQQTS